MCSLLAGGSLSRHEAPEISVYGCGCVNTSTYLYLGFPACSCHTYVHTCQGHTAEGYRGMLLWKDPGAGNEKNLNLGS